METFYGFDPSIFTNFFIEVEALSSFTFTLAPLERDPSLVENNFSVLFSLFELFDSYVEATDLNQHQLSMNISYLFHIIQSIGIHFRAWYWSTIQYTVYYSLLRSLKIIKFAEYNYYLWRHRPFVGFFASDFKTQFYRISFRCLTNTMDIFCLVFINGIFEFANFSRQPQKVTPWF